MLNRRDLLLSAGAAAATGFLPQCALPARAKATDGRVLTVNMVANTLGVHVPFVGALHETLSSMPGYGPVQVMPVSKHETMVQSILTGSVDICSSDAIMTLRAIEAGADLKIIGNAYMNSSLVFVANAEVIKEDKDLEKPNVVVAVNSPGDFTHIALIKPLRQRGVDIKKVNIISMGGSGTRLRALVAGKVHAVPLHFDQAEPLVKDGKFKILIEPWKEYDQFLGEVWIAGGAWLRDKANQQAATDLLKATIQGFRAAHDDPAWYARIYRQYGTQDGMKDAPDAAVEHVRQKLADVVKSWPRDMGHRIETYQELLPIYKEGGAVAGTVDLTVAVETRYSEKALQELG